MRRDGHQVRTERHEPLAEPRTGRVADAHDADPGPVQELDRLPVEQVEVARHDGQPAESGLGRREAAR